MKHIIKTIQTFITKHKKTLSKYNDIYFGFGITLFIVCGIYGIFRWLGYFL